MKAVIKIAGIALLCLCGVPGNCAPGGVAPLVRVATPPPMLNVLMWQKFWAVRPGMTPEQAMRAGPFLPVIPLHGERPGWRTLAYSGPLTRAERDALRGKMMEMDVQVVMNPGPVSAANPSGGSLNPSGGSLNPSGGSLNPSGGSLNPTMTGETIATVSAPYMGGGALCID